MSECVRHAVYIVHVQKTLVFIPLFITECSNSHKVAKWPMFPVIHIFAKSGQRWYWPHRADSPGLDNLKVLCSSSN